MHVDDDLDIRMIVEMSLHLDPLFDVISVATAAEALSLLKNASAVLPAAIILDYLMPGVSGIDLVQQIHAIPACRRIPFVFLTARATASTMAMLETTGCAGIITKPFDPTTLAAQVRGLLGIPRNP